MKNRRKIEIFAISLLCLLVTSCDVFNTREPEPPDSGKSTFIPPTNYDIVISNFQNAIKDINTSNYISCFSEKGYEYKPSSDIMATYNDLFSNWDVNSEKFYFSGVLSENTNSEQGKISWSSPNYELTTTDSVVFIANYKLTYKFLQKGLTEYSGRMELTIFRDLSTGLWSIKRWHDYQQNNDTIKETWSNLKAKYSI